MKIGVVILNYLNWNDTIECVDSLLKQTYTNLEIIIVDNDSQNESIDNFLEKYSMIENIHILESSVNEGFARGNNIGITYCMDQLNIFNVFVANNDTVFTDKNYFVKLVNKPIDKNIGVVGTKIIGSDGLNQNPFKARIDWKFLIRRYLVLKWNILRNSMQNSKFGFNRIIINFYYNKKSKKAINNSNNEIEKKLKHSLGSSYDLAMLHGSAIFLTENYLNLIRGFYPKTFLYNEERILYMTLKKAGLRTSFREDLELYHKEDQSSALSFGNDSYKMKVFSFDSTKETIHIKVYTLNKIKDITNQYQYRFRILTKNEMLNS